MTARSGGPNHDAAPSSTEPAPLARLVRALRDRVPLTQEELAHIAGLSVGTVQGLEAGRIRRPRIASLRSLADALSLTDRDRQALVAAARGEPVEVGGIRDDGSSRGRTPVEAARDAPTDPSQLPAGIADFTGRESHVARLESALLGDDTRTQRAVAISAVAGRGGVGKSALAIHVAHRLAGSFPDGQLYVNLRDAQAEPVDPTRALARFLRALRIAESAMPEGLDERAEVYRERIAGRRCLVVLDNAASEAQVRPLLPGTPICAVLVTSRQQLAGLEGTQVVDLDVFEPDQAVELLAKIAGPERVAAEPRVARDIAKLCGYLPLAMRIAGARLTARPHWRLAQLVQRLADERRRLDELAAGDLEVRASIGLSYRALGDDTRCAFRLLGLLEVPDFAVRGVAALMDTTVDQATDIVDRLVTAQLLDVAGTDPSGNTRYRLHDLVRLYARELAADVDTDHQRRTALTRALGDDTTNCAN